MRHYQVVDQWYKEIDKRFPHFSEEVKKELAIVIYDELDYIVLMGIQRPGGLFEKLKIPFEPNKPVAVFDVDFTKFIP